MTTYSIRLTDQERSTLEDALAVIGWTPTYFITRAALERAANVLNTRTPRSFDFDNWARRLAKQWSAPSIMVEQGDGSVTDVAEFEREYNVSFFTEPPRLTEHDVEQLTDANGGTEFLAMILEECRRIVVDRTKLPAPINPTKIG